MDQTVNNFECSGDFSDDLNGIGDRDGCSNHNLEDCTGVTSLDSQNFTSEKELHFTAQFEGGYDLFNLRYEEWLNCMYKTIRSMQKLDLQNLRITTVKYFWKLSLKT